MLCTASNGTPNWADLVIVELGGNDMLNETDPQTVFGNLDQIIRLCKAEGARVPECYRSLNSGPCTRPRSILIPIRTLAARHKIPFIPSF